MHSSKGEKLSSVVRDAFVSVVRNENVNTPQQHGKTIKSLMMKALGQRDMSVQEVMHQILSLKFFSSSFNVITASLKGSRKLSRENNDIITELSTLDHYATRENFKNDYPGIMTLNFLQFVSNYFVKNDALHKRHNAVIVCTVPSYNCNPKGHDYPLYCKYQLLKYKPWRQRQSNAWDDLEENSDTYVSYWDSFLESEQGQTLVPNWGQEIDRILCYINALIQTDDFEENETPSGTREEWMLLAELNTSQSSQEYMESLPDSVFTDSRNYTEEQIGNMPTWVKDMKENYSIQQSNLETIFDVDSLNEAQRIAYDTVFEHFTFNDSEQLLLILTGLAGSGKSYVIESLKNLLGDNVRTCSYYGVAAFSVKGLTLHSLLQLPIHGKKIHL